MCVTITFDNGELEKYDDIIMIDSSQKEWEIVLKKEAEAIYIVKGSVSRIVIRMQQC